MRDLLRPSVGRIGPETVKAALFDDFATPYSVCRPPRENAGNNLTATVAMVVMQPSRGIMEVARLPALNRSFTQYRLAMDEAAFRAAAE